MEKVIRDGKVAVLYSPGFGAGWYTWNSGVTELVFDSIIVNAVLDGDIEKARARAEEICPDGYFGGADNLTVGWVPVGEAFEITEYYGAESLKIIGEQSYLIA